MVVKPLFGSEGRGMVRVSDPEMAWRTFRTLETHGELSCICNSSCGIPAGIYASSFSEAKC